MAFFRGDIYSYALDKMTPLQLYLPGDDVRRFQVQQPQRTLILLHGLEGNSSYWARYTSVERYAQSRNLALVMPEGEMSMYADMRCGQRYATYLGEELPQLLHDMFGLAIEREKLSIAGLSMGGYGALRLALAHPQRFGRCASFSGALMLGSEAHLQELRAYRDPGRPAAYVEQEEIARSMYHAARGAYGEALVYAPENDLLQLAAAAVASGAPLPQMLLTCGTEDFLYAVNCEYHQRLNALGITHQFDTWPGVHDWKFWEESIHKHIDFFIR